MLTKTNFKCQQCGDCCKPLVKLSNDDIKRIENADYKRESFLDSDHNSSFVIKRINNRCIFSYYKNNKYWCRIYRIKPKNCMIYPFFEEKVESCKPDKLLKWW